MTSARKKLLFLLIIPFLFSSCSKDETLFETQTDSTLEIVAQKSLLAENILNVPYGNNAQQIYDIYLPADRSFSTTKVLILIHGGGWRNGDKASMMDYIPFLQAAHPDHAIVNMNYVLAEFGVSYAFPNQFEDIQSLINSLSDRRYEYEILPEFGLIGRSAGAHLALIYDYNYDSQDDVKFVCSMAGPTDFTDPVFTNNPDFLQVLNILVDPTIYPNNENNLEILSPAFQVSAISSPTIIFHGRTDLTVPVTNARFLRKRLLTNRIKHRLRIFAGGHGNWTDNDMAKLEVDLSSFIKTHLKIQ